MLRAVRRGPGGAGRVDQPVRVVVQLAAADVLEREVAADEALLRFRAGDPTDAAERRQIQKALGVGVRLLPGEERRVLDVVGIRETHQGLIPGDRTAGTAAQGDEREGALADALLAVEESHAHGHARVAAGVAIVDLSREPGAALFGRRPLRTFGQG